MRRSAPLPHQQMWRSRRMPAQRRIPARIPLLPLSPQRAATRRQQSRGRRWRRRCSSTGHPPATTAAATTSGAKQNAVTASNGAAFAMRPSPIRMRTRRCGGRTGHVSAPPSGSRPSHRRPAALRVSRHPSGGPSHRTQAALGPRPSLRPHGATRLLPGAPVQESSARSAALVRGTGHPAGDLAALNDHMRNSSTCLAAAGRRPSKEPCPCGRMIAARDAWARQQHSWHCPGRR